MKNEKGMSHALRLLLGSCFLLRRATQLLLLYRRVGLLYISYRFAKFNLVDIAGEAQTA